MVNLSITEAINFLKEKDFSAYFEGNIEYNVINGYGKFIWNDGRIYNGE